MEGVVGKSTPHKNTKKMERVTSISNTNHEKLNDSYFITYLLHVTIQWKNVR